MLEQELKFTVADASILDDVLASPLIQPLIRGESNPSAERFQGVYYDTPDSRLQSRRCSLRARREGSRFRAALKMPGAIIDGLSRREEFEIDIHDWPAAVSDLPDEEFRLRVCELIAPDSPLIATIEVDMQRRIAHLAFGSSQIELVLDQGEIRGGGLSQSLCEIELELIQGKVADILQLGEHIESRFPVVRSTLSKHAIGIKLREQSNAS